MDTSAFLSAQSAEVDYSESDAGPGAGAAVAAASAASDEAGTFDGSAAAESDTEDGAYASGGADAGAAPPQHR